MAAYVIGDIKITDPEKYAEYAVRVPATSEAYGVRYLVRGVGKCEIAEGDWLPERLVLAEYESMETVKAWYYSPEYSPLVKLRQSASTGNMVFVEGVSGSAGRVRNGLRIRWQLPGTGCTRRGDRRDLGAQAVGGAGVQEHESGQGLVLL